jgi:ribosome-associated protein
MDVPLDFLSAQRARKHKVKSSTASDMLNLILHVLDEHKAEEIVTVDLSGKSPLADYMVIASGRSSRQVQALADYLARAIKEVAYAPKVEGLSQGDWVLLDSGDVIVHLFRPEVREFYNIESMWGTTPTSLPPSSAIS